MSPPWAWWTAPLATKPSSSPSTYWPFSGAPRCLGDAVLFSASNRRKLSFNNQSGVNDGLQPEIGASGARQTSFKLPQARRRSTITSANSPDRLRKNVFAGRTVPHFKTPLPSLIRPSCCPPGPATSFICFVTAVPLQYPRDCKTRYSLSRCPCRPSHPRRPVRQSRGR